MCRVTAFVLVLGVTLAATATAFVAPGGAIKRKIGSNNPTFRLYMAADKVKTKDAPSKTSASSKSAPTPFFAKKEPKTADKKSSETTSDFNPFQLAAEVNGNVNINGQAELQLEEDKQELGIWAARAILLLVAAIWGTSFASVKYLGDLCFHPPCNHPPSEAAFARFGVAALVSLPLLFKQNKDVIMAGLECGLFITLGYVCQSLALDTISSGKCAFICSLTVVVVPIVSALVYGKPIKATNILAAVVALSGVSVLEGMVDFNSLLGIQPAMADAGVVVSAETVSAITSTSVETAVANVGPLGALASSLGVNKGDILALGQPIGFGYTFTRIEFYQEKFKEVPNRVITIAAAQCVAVGALSLLWVLYDYHGILPNFEYMLEPHRVATILWTGIVTTVFAIYLNGVALQKASATDAAITFASEPVWASLFGYLLLKEELGTNSYIGGAIILLACLIGAVSDLPATADEALDVDSS